MQKLSLFIFNRFIFNDGFLIETMANKISPLKMLLRKFSAARELTLKGKNQTAYFTTWAGGASRFFFFSFGRKPSGKSIVLKLESSYDWPYGS